jgi:hypothetical protein
VSFSLLREGLRKSINKDNSVQVVALRHYIQLCGSFESSHESVDKLLYIIVILVSK